MNNKLDNRDGKDVQKQVPGNNKKANNMNQPNRIKNKNPEAKKETQSTETKKIPIPINKNINSTEKTTHKGHVIKLENKENKVPSTKPLDQNEVSSIKNTISSTVDTKKSVEGRLEGGKAPNYEQNRKIEKGSFKLSPNTGKWLLVIAVVSFIAWAVIFFYYHIGGNTHMLLALAVICAVISLVGKRNKY